MKYFYLLVCLTSCWLTVVRLERMVEGDPTCGIHSMYDTDEFCLKDGSGYESWMCDDIDPWNDHNVWIHEKTVMCQKPDTCRCFENDWYAMECECVNLRKPPSFPPTGVIRWNGTHYYDNSWWVHHENPRTVYMPGEIHRDSSGRFLWKWTKIIRWPEGKAPAETKVQFQILIPNGNNTFLKYTGDLNSKTCSWTNVTYGGDLTAIWTKHYRAGKTYSLDDSRESYNKKGIDIEDWKLLFYVEDGMDHWEWTIEYDKMTKYAIPVRYYHRSEDGFSGILEKTNLDYTYETLKENDESFRLEDYCNIEKW